MRRRGFLKGLLAAPLLGLMAKSTAEAVMPNPAKECEALGVTKGRESFVAKLKEMLRHRHRDPAAWQQLNACGVDTLDTDVIKNGWSDQQYMGTRWSVVHKHAIDDMIREEDERFLENIRGIAGDQVVFDEQVLPRLGQAVDPESLGKAYVLEDEGMYLPREPYMLEFFAYQTEGVTIGYTGALSRVDFS